MLPASLSVDRINPQRLAAAAVLTGLALRLLRLGNKSFWLDEARSLLFAQAGSAQIWAGKGEQYHPPLYYMLLHDWAKLGTAEYTLRLSSVLVDTVIIALIYALAHRLAGRAVARSAAWLTALSPLLVWYAQELRSYSLLTMLGVVSALALTHLAMHPAWGQKAGRISGQVIGQVIGWWLFFVVSTTAALYTHYNAILLVPVHLALLLLIPLAPPARRRCLLAWLAAWPLIGLLYWPWLSSPGAAAFAGLLTGGHLYPAEYLAARVGISSGAATFLIMAALLALSGLALAAVAVLQHRQPQIWRTVADRAWLRGALIVLFMLGAALVVTPRGYSIKRLVVVLWPYALLALAWVFPWGRQARRGLAVLLAASLLATLINVVLIPKDQWRALARSIAAQSHPGDIVWIQPGWHGAPFNYYLPAQVELPVSNPPATAEQRAATLQQQARIWHVYQTHDLTQVDPDRTVERLLAEQMEAVASLDFYRVHATLYQRRPSE
jgi:uncharacterized membrane protein